MGESESTTCPICGQGTLITIDFGQQQPESRQVQTFTWAMRSKVRGSRPPTQIGSTWSATSEETVTPADTEE